MSLNRDSEAVTAIKVESKVVDELTDAHSDDPEDSDPLTAGMGMPRDAVGTPTCRAGEEGGYSPPRGRRRRLLLNTPILTAATMKNTTIPVTNTNPATRLPPSMLVAIVLMSQ